MCDKTINLKNSESVRDNTNLGVYIASVQKIYSNKKID